MDVSDSSLTLGSLVVCRPRTLAREFLPRPTHSVLFGVTPVKARPEGDGANPGLVKNVWYERASSPYVALVPVDTATPRAPL